MKANNEHRASPKWRALYQAAVFELDTAKFESRFSEAERAIMDRMEDLNRSGDGSESAALMKALNTLRDLRAMSKQG